MLSLTPASMPLAQSASGLQELLPSFAAAGRARLRFWGIDVYDASLWVAPGFRRADYASHGFALQLQYLRAFTAAEIAQRSIEEMRRGPALSEAQAVRWQSELARLLPDVRKGDRLTGVNRPGEPVAFLLNGRPAGEIADPAFANAFFGIWLAPHTSEPAMREALLGSVPR